MLKKNSSLPQRNKKKRKFIVGLSWFDDDESWKGTQCAQIYVLYKLCCMDETNLSCKDKTEWIDEWVESTFLWKIQQVYQMKKVIKSVQCY